MSSAAMRVEAEEAPLCLEAMDLELDVTPPVRRSWSAVARTALGLGAAIGCAGYALATRSERVGVVSDAKRLVSDYVAPPFADMICPLSTAAELTNVETNCAGVVQQIDGKKNIIDCQKASFELPGQLTNPGEQLVYYYKDTSVPDIAGNSATPGICLTFPMYCTSMAALGQDSDLILKMPALNFSDAQNFHTCQIQQPQCFPGDATVTVRGRGSTAMASVRVGDQVLVESKEGALEYEEVLSFLHRAPLAQGRVSRVLHAQGELRATANHLVFVADAAAASGRSSKMVGELVPGDALLAASGGASSAPVASPVVAVQGDVARDGVFAPLTASGTVVVDGVVASNYGSPSEVTLPHGSAHAAFFVARAWYAVAGAMGLARDCVAEADEVHVVAKAYLDMGLSSFLRSAKA